MRITHVITRLVVGGAQENTVASVLGLNRIPGVESHLISGLTHGPEGSIENQLAGSPGVLTLLPSLVRPVHPWLDARAWQSLTSHFRKSSPDIVHTHSGKAGIVGRFAARTARVPLILHTIHGPSFGPFQGHLANALFRNAERLAGKVTDHFVVVALAMARQYQAAGIGRPEDFTRIWSGFDLNPFLNASNDLALRASLGLTESHFVVGKVARLFENKGHDDLIDAASDLVRDLPSIRFLLVGDGADRHRLQQRIESLGLTPFFIFTGLVPPDQVCRYVGLMDVLVHLSRREGLARALPQALAASRPVVAYDCDGASEVCINGRTGFLVPPGNRTALKERLLLLSRDIGLRQQLGRHGRELVQDGFPLSRMIQDLHALYLRLLNRIPARRQTSPFLASTHRS